ncbi:acyl-CoA thioesterase II [Colletotrichum paranaense]|uniref:Acyl-CoA thioesterase II n=10 Tax=Colletotrichum acutatum species complex TaxID=2707335 RepID=A0A9P7RKR1_9PEZI|nr:acyl-CoA thioesterase II [Colletotrichum scovillei]XP_049144844.1 acyl-CoA thioesterase II [Colletotrichum lupini]XP_060321111.1 acyl-CoA thioesterase II [Colletotrichum costaricense]XP_060346929.1 acyl-CoA thioesterase II [Colletotrichum paranaense]XP_060382363.1 acyl-CoA thioesterase II [Colletotrichum tamarilloi]XP_060392579.1 acyl-CoA thioesterase II [Colletotrichum abscissum]KAI3544854.1 acyl-CoA thioesterase II [Colletotrichum filicis]KAK0382408.1 acyl-CoA thioesterase II [Colletotr
MASGRSTIIRPPPDDPNKSPMENVLEVTELGVLGPDIFTNTRTPWHPPGARGIFGGAVIAQCLASAQKTVPNDFFLHSCHCYFLLAGSSEIPILFHVERVRDGRSFATRTVQARQRGRCIFTTTVSFVKEGSGGEKQVRHAAPLPDGVKPPPDNWKGEPEWSTHSPFQTHRISIVGARDKGKRLDELKSRNWVRARGRISVSGGHQAHLNALAYMSDSYFIGTVGRIHRLWRFPFKPEEFDDLPPELREQVERLNEFEGNTEAGGIEYWKTRPHLGMMVSLDHSIYFHEPRRVRADEWMFTEMESPWSGDGRGVVLQKIFASDGTLLATCVQEGVVRLKQQEDDDEKEPKSKL